MQLDVLQLVLQPCPDILHLLPGSIHAAPSSCCKTLAKSSDVVLTAVQCRVDGCCDLHDQRICVHDARGDDVAVAIQLDLQSTKISGRRARRGERHTVTVPQSKRFLCS